MFRLRPQCSIGEASLIVAELQQKVKMEAERLSKIMAQRGMCSRREADRYIERGWVLVDGKPVTQLGAKVYPDQHIALRPEATATQDRLVTILLNKPLGVVSGQPEKGYQSAAQYLSEENHWARDKQNGVLDSVCFEGLAPAGRLDIDSQGLLVLTQNGVIARQLIGAESKVDKEYVVGVEGIITPAALSKLRHGLVLDKVRLRPALIEELGQGKLRFILREGRKRQIRRMCELVGLRVTHLQRIRIGAVQLGDLPYGKWRFLRPDERF